MTQVKIPNALAHMTPSGSRVLTDRETRSMQVEGWDRNKHLEYYSVPLISVVDATTYADARVRESQPWQPIETATKTGRTVLLGFVNSHGNWRTMLGRWISKEEILDEWEDGDLFDEGWYEISVEADDVPNCWLTNPSHWMPLPLPPVE